MNEIIRQYKIMDEIDIESASANQLQASSVPGLLREFLRVNPEESETDDGSGESCYQIGNVLDAFR